MKLWNTIFDTLGTPDDQGKDWYAWATNQCSHALFGVFIALLFPSAPLAMTLIFALLKELADIARSMDNSKIIDSFVDITFWMIGASVVTLTDPVIGMFLMFFGLLIGIIPRVRKALKTE